MPQRGGVVAGTHFSALVIPDTAATTGFLPSTPRWELATKEMGSATAKSDLATSKNTPATP
jgi:hypothetical protein